MKYTIKELIDKSFYLTQVIERYYESFTREDVLYLIDFAKEHSNVYEFYMIDFLSYHFLNSLLNYNDSKLFQSYFESTH